MTNNSPNPGNTQRRAARLTVGALFPDDVDVSPATVERSTTVAEAVRAMTEGELAQLLVVEGNRVCGVFSLWGLANHLTDSPEVSIGECSVGDVMEAGVPTVTLDQQLDHALLLLKEHEALPVVSPNGPQAIVTRTDVMNCYHRIARKFLLVEEIEETLRAIIAFCLPAERLDECIANALSGEAERTGRSAPTTLKDMSFGHYVALIDNPANYEHFRAVLGSNRKLIKSKLGTVNRSRNVIFHFRRELTKRELEGLTRTRDLLVEKYERAVQSLGEVTGE